MMCPECNFSILPIAFAIPVAAGLAAIGWHVGRLIACKWFGPINISVGDINLHTPNDTSDNREGADA